MRKSLLLAMTMIVLFPSLASAQTPKLGDYQLDWASLHTPIRLEPASLAHGSGRIVVEPPRTPDCPSGTVSMVLNAPSGTWCFDSGGRISIEDQIFGGFTVAGV